MRFNLVAKLKRGQGGKGIYLYCLKLGTFFLVIFNFTIYVAAVSNIGMTGTLIHKNDSNLNER